MTADLDLTVPLRPCTPWCTDGDGHPGDHPEDRSCWSGLHRVPMQRRPLVKYYTDEWHYDFVTVHLWRRPTEAEPFVMIHHQYADHELPFTLDEARSLHEALTQLLDLA